MENENTGICIALAGNPNCGKTTLFNALTGSNQYVGNWPGVTVEKKEGLVRGKNGVAVVDLPGVYSLSPYSPEERVARDYLVGGAPDVILNIVDGTRLERSLYLTMQLLELGLPVVVAINMMDSVRKNGNTIDIPLLSGLLGVEVVEISALKGTGVNRAVDMAVNAARAMALPPVHTYSAPVEQAVLKIIEAVATAVPKNRQRWYGIKLFEQDKIALGELGLSQEKYVYIKKYISLAERELDDDGESIIISEKYNMVEGFVHRCFKRSKKTGATVSDKIDRIVTSRTLGIPIFLGVMLLVYYSAMMGVGAAASHWVGSVLFGRLVPSFFNNVLAAVNCARWLRALIVDGVLAGVGSVLSFVPQLAVLFALLAFLEGCGYMSRVAFVLDKAFRCFGLSGKSFIPMLIGTGCGVPGIMASRTIENESDRRMTVITTTFVPCSAKIPVIGLIAGAMFGGSPFVAASVYIIGICSVLISGVILKKTRLFAGKSTPFVMELPAYRLPTVQNILHSVWERCFSFIKKAGTVIALFSALIWVLQRIGIEKGSFGIVGTAENSVLAYMGNALAPLFEPLGWGGWQTAVASLTGLVAKENLVSTFGILFNCSGELSDNGNEIWQALAMYLQKTSGGNGALAGYSYLIFNLLCAPCVAAVGAIRREMNSAKWTLFAVGYQCGYAYLVALIIYQFGCFFTGCTNPKGLCTAACVLALFLYMLFRKNKYK